MTRRISLLWWLARAGGRGDRGNNRVLGDRTMNHSGMCAKRVVKRLWKLGWGLLFVSTMTVLSVLGAGYADHFAVTKSLASPIGTSTAAQR